MGLVLRLCARIPIEQSPICIAPHLVGKFRFLLYSLRERSQELVRHATERSHQIYKQFLFLSNTF